jgi:8-oxo-dGTP pyrophosphatase MutT (NUDIX family)
LSEEHRKVMVIPLRMNREWEVLILKRGPEKGGVWAPVTGNAEPGESPEVAAKRELDEETGLGQMAALHKVNFVNRFEKTIEGTPTTFVEDVFAAVVRLGAAVRLSPEHVDARWVPPETAEAMVAFEGCKEGVRRAVAAVTEALR